MDVDHAAAKKFASEWAIWTEVKPGTRLFTDDGFTCMRPWEVRIVREDDKERLYVACLCGWDGKHYLEGQVEGNRVVGFYSRFPRWLRKRLATDQPATPSADSPLP
jgi:hypothetical protein